MSRPSRIPQYPSKSHKSGQARITLGGRDRYLGVWDSPESHQEYERVVAEWLANGRAAPVRPARDLTVDEVMLPYLRHARAYYVKDGAPTSQVWLVEKAVARLSELYGPTPAREFGPLKLKAIQQRLAGEGLSRTYVNQTVGNIQRAFTWCVSEELLPATVDHGLRSVRPLQKGRSAARDAPPVAPVDPAHVAATLPHCHRILAAMIRAQQLTGARPGEICSMRRRDVSTGPAERLTLPTGRAVAAQVVDGVPVWLYLPHTHKTDHRRKTRIIAIGPQAQGVLRPFLDRGPDDHLFSPREAAEALLRETGRAVRFGRTRTPGERYTTSSYGNALDAAIERANRRGAAVPHWHLHQLRHAVATDVSEDHDAQTAADVLGHSRPDTTLVYIERAVKKAAAVMAKVG